MTQEERRTPRFARRTGAERVRRWAPRFWTGCTLRGLLRLVHRYRWAVAPGLVYVLILNFAVAATNSVLAWLERLRYGRRIDATRLTAAPLFIVGHWRSGTTLLHELLTLDPRHRSPSNFECFMANHFLLTRPLAWLYGAIMPTHRPMDEMPVEWDGPQEDEFALCVLGLRSPYETIAFPNGGPRATEYFALREVPKGARATFLATLDRFLRRLTLWAPGRIILKSPPHSFRIELLLAAYPEARFVHIVRDPLEVFPSTLNLWNELYARQGYQRPKTDWLEEYVLETFAQMHEAIAAARPSVPAGQWHFVRFEDLVNDPVAELERLYHGLSLGPIDVARPAVRTYLEARRTLPRTRYSITEAQRARVAARWGAFAREHGYSFENRATGV